jgi:two-component system phosphate regulon sensor histidine kinase PhoR
MTQFTRLSIAATGIFLLTALAGYEWGARVGLTVLLVALVGFGLGRFTSYKNRALDQSSPAPQPVRESSTPSPKGPAPASALLEATMDGMREGVLVLDQALRIVTSNSAARAIFGTERNSINRALLTELTRNPSINSAFRGALERGERSEVKVELVDRDRRVFDLRVVPLRLVLDENPRGAIGVFFDITRLERLEHVRQEFLSNVSHELRTPLTSILAFVETLEDAANDDPEARRRFLSIIRKNASRMHNLVNDILELSAIEAGNLSIEYANIRLHSMVTDVSTALASKTEEKSVTINNQVGPQTFVFADPRRLEQMLLNLIDNAVKFNRPEGTVTVSHERGIRDRIMVRDTGDGIPSEHLARIFERFYRVDRARSREMGGTGLGLAIVKHLAKAQGGEVAVRSTPNEGSIFIIELPLAAVPVEAPTPPPSQTSKPLGRETAVPADAL